MDDNRLGDAFRAAAGDPPPASFDVGDILGTSHRLTARRQTRIRAATALGVVLLASGAFAGVVAVTTGGSETTSAQVPAEAAATDNKNRAVAPGQADASPMSTEGSCAVDPDLATALAAVLRDGISGPAIPATICPDGARAAAYQVTDGAKTGVVQALLLPPGHVLNVIVGPTATAPASNGTTIMLLSSPPKQAAPYGDQLPTFAKAIAARF
jgi:hypothetical protein